METCQFTYNRRVTYLPLTTLGIERPWEDMRKEFGYKGNGVPGATYYKTISKDGPEGFAVVNENIVYYYEYDDWHRYNTARDIRYGTIDLTDANPTRAKTDEEDKDYFDRVHTA
ncbi:unnamed protein product [Adineta ricciae]|uniref:Uncharacterized protein n=1 Tax=Adineta ricciae TaxID=249248 RepID=A0A815SVR6_ADIRI|nr:unnamed protein product [Adineta ricciae]CAF1533231.1 unnamed protein product [Adineta ricciae]